jgi:hypothetical protein
LHHTDADAQLASDLLHAAVTLQQGCGDLPLLICRDALAPDRTAGPGPLSPNAIMTNPYQVTMVVAPLHPVKLPMALDAERDQIGLLVRTSLRPGDQVVVM